MIRSEMDGIVARLSRGINFDQFMRRRVVDMMRRLFSGLVVLMVVGMVQAGYGQQGRQDPAVLLAAQREAMAKLAYMDGVWRGPGWTILPSGEKLNFTQTERVGPFLDGAVKVIEGRGYDGSGKVGFNAFGTVSYDPAKKGYTLHSYAEGRVGDFVLTPTDEGCVWEIPAGPMTIRFTAVIKNGTWREVGDRIMPGKEPVRFLEMNLKRIGDTKWPAEGTISPK